MSRSFDFMFAKHRREKKSMDLFMECLRYEYAHLRKHKIDPQVSYENIKKYAKEVIDNDCTVTYNAFIDLWAWDVIYAEMDKEEFN